MTNQTNQNGETMTDTTGLRIAKLSISYDRGTARNSAEDLGLDVKPAETEDGKVVRGLGSHWRSVEAKVAVQERVNEEGRIRDLFKRRFLSAPIKGFFIVQAAGEANEYLATIDPPPASDVQVSISEYVLGVVTQAPADVKEWGERIDKQLAKIPLGRGQAANSKGLGILRALASAPVISAESRADLLKLIEGAELENVNRVDFRRKLKAIAVKPAAGQVVVPRRARPAAPPVVAEPAAAAPAAPLARPRRRRRARPAPSA